MLYYELCKRILNRLTPVFNKDVNIIGIDGVIIASSNKKRENTYHEGARICASSNRNIVITKENQHIYRGSKSGVNMPITYNNSVIGVIGITGTAEEVIPYGPLIKELVEMIINEMDTNILKKSKANSRKELFKDIIQDKDSKDKESYISRAKLLGIELGVSRKMVSFKLLELKKSKYQEVETLINKFSNSEIININDEKLVLLFKNYNDIDKTLEKVISELEMNLDEKIKYYFLIGEECKNIVDYHNSYSSMSVIESIIPKDTIEKLIYMRDYEVRLLINGLSKESKKIYISKYSNIFSGKDKVSKELVKTIKSYFIN
ncbi:sugar diacid recognition domain-containing protein, partial [Clostridium sp.]|uniref:CdaR family transcriptional regulator n=1 Tax=Clostridium sp. TaxID=1506 RepID=UPI00262BE378